VGAQVMGWSPHQRARRARTRIKRAARTYVETSDRLAGMRWGVERGRVEEDLLRAWRELVRAASVLTAALEGSRL
jgi:hypothetical protein